MGVRLLKQALPVNQQLSQKMDLPTRSWTWTVTGACRFDFKTVSHALVNVRLAILPADGSKIHRAFFAFTSLHSTVAR